MLEESEHIKIFKLVKEILSQNLRIIDKFIEHTEQTRSDIFAGTRDKIYNSLCQIENFLLFFLYNTLERSDLKIQVEACLTLIYHYRIRYSRHFTKL